MTVAAPADTVAGPDLTGPARPVRAWRVRLSRAAAPLGLTPFALYVLLFLALPTALAVGTGLFDEKGAFTWDNFSALGDPVVLRTFRNSILLSLVSAAVGAVVGALVCVATLGLREGGFARGLIDSIASVIAQFGGVMLAFAFIATIGLRGMVTVWLQTTLHVNIFSSGAWIYAMPGLYLPYMYFQIPMMVITFLPALTALRPQWAEATLTLGGTVGTFWLRVAIPVLAPSFLASFLLLFANGFSSFATAAALASQGAQIVPLQIQEALTSETVLGRQNLAGALAFGMIVVMALVMWAYSAVQRRAARWRG